VLELTKRSPGGIEIENNVDSWDLLVKDLSLDFQVKDFNQLSDFRDEKRKENPEKILYKMK
jgi:hypothetical protein